MKLLDSIALIALTAVSAAVAANSDSSTEQALRDLESQWTAAAGAKDIDKTVSFYADDATVLPANAPVATTKEAIRNLWQGLFNSPGLKISWRPTKVEVAKGGDMAYVTGTYELSMNDASGNPVNDHGKYVTVWEKQANGSWKCGADIWNSDLPATPAAK
jgi:uncharacterized protein (TIGR02246 family)